MAYKIYPILLGILRGAERSMFLYRTDCGVKMDAAYMVFLVQGNGLNILVDSGAPDPELAKTMPYPLLDEAKYLSDELAARGLKGEDIDAVILTHLHWDHCYNLKLFPNAKVYVQKKEVEHAAAPSAFDRKAYVAAPGCGVPGWFDAFDRIERVDGDREIFPGITGLLSPGHTPGEMSVLVETGAGKYIIAGDAMPLYENIEQNIQNGITIDFDAGCRTYDRLRSFGAELIPGHDLKTAERKVFG